MDTQFTDEPVVVNSAVAASIDEIDYSRRFGGVTRLYGPQALEILGRAHVCVIGVGGVGSWVVEGLARSAVGEITMIDLDHVAESNINRQIHALESTLGQAKVEAMAERVAAINPRCRVHRVDDFVTPDNLDDLIGPINGSPRFDYVIDAIDSVKAKTALIAYCRNHAIALITIGAAGGQLDPTRVRVTDLAHTEHEPLLAKVRKQLRSRHGFPRNIKLKFGIDAVFSDEPLIYPTQEVGAVDATTNETEITANPSVTGLNCAGFGSSVAVTAVFGFVAAGHVLRRLTQAARDKAVPPV